MKSTWFYRILLVLGIVLLLFILIPLLSTIFSTNPADLWLSIIDPEVNRSILITFAASGIATITTVFFGVPTSYLLARNRFPCKQIVESILDLPIILPHTAAGLALLLVFGSEGILGKALKPLGIHFIDSLWGISVAMAFVSFPYLINSSKQAFVNIDPETELSAQVDGASHWQSFIHISLPLASRGILSGVLMMWSRGISEFGAVVILAYHPRILPVLLFERFQGFGLDAAKPLAVIMITVVFIIFVLTRLLFQVGRKN
jgi:molybdate/tungstate transport system permease protein